MLGDDGHGRYTYDKMRILVDKVSEHPKRYYPTSEGKELLETLKTMGVSREDLYKLMRPLRDEFEDESIQQAFVEDMLDIITGNYVGMNMAWEQNQ